MNFFLYLSPRSLLGGATFSFHLFLFPAGLPSLCLCFRVATAALWITKTPHPYSKQHTEAQMLAYKHTSINVSNLGVCKQQMRGTPVTSGTGTIYLPARSHNQLYASLEARLRCSPCNVFYSQINFYFVFELSLH